MSAGVTVPSTLNPQPSTGIYLDNNATTPADPRVVEAMFPYFTEMFGNAASTGHAFGQAARQAVERSRECIAGSIGAREPREIVFTSGATESDNLAVKGVAHALRDRGDHVVTVKTEHKAILDSCHRLEAEGFHVTYLGVDRDGLIDPEELAAAITPRTVLVTVMYANNEIGVVQDIGAIGRICRERGVLFHTDATQGVGKLPFDVDTMNVDLASFTAHKIYGPKGAGALYVRQGAVQLEPLIDGGGHEQGFRSGTLNVTGIVGLARAVELCMQELEDETRRLTALRERLRVAIIAQVVGVALNGHPERRLPGHLSLLFEGLQGQRLLAEAPEIALSTTAACSTESAAPSHVLAALGLSNTQAASTVRFGIGRFNTQDEIDRAARRIGEAASALGREVARQR